MEPDVLWAQFVHGRSPELRAALVERYQPLVRVLAASVYGKRVGDYFEFDDLYQWGMVGLLQAIDRFQPDFGNKFETYAEHRIRGEIMSQLSKTSEFACQLSARKQALKDRAELPMQEPLSPFDALFSLSIGLAIGFMLEGTRMYQAEGEAGQESGYQSLAIKQLSEQLRGKVASLPERQGQVIRLHYFSGLQFVEIAEILEVSKGRVSQLHGEALSRLRDHLVEERASFL